MLGDLKMLALNIGLMWPQAKEGWQLLDAGKARNRFFP